MLITCDMGEGLNDIDRQLMPFVDMASIACGGHTGDVNSIANCLVLAKKHSVSVGAHPSYPDKENFGRKPIAISAEDLTTSIKNQLQLFLEQCLKNTISFDYIKPHGALYNDISNDITLFETLLHTTIDFCRKHAIQPLPLVVQAGPKIDAYEKKAAQQRITLMPEAFADRTYRDNGTLVPRSEPHAVIHDTMSVVKQYTTITNGYVTTENNQHLALKAHCICVHSDSPNAIEKIKLIKQVSKN